MPEPTVVDTAELAALSEEFETADATEILTWAGRRFPTGLVATSSLEDAVLVDLVARTAPGAEIVFLDTQYHFAETLWLLDELRLRHGLQVNVVGPAPGVERDNRWQSDVEACCAIRKVEPLERTLAGKAAWITGIRRVDGPTRAEAPIVSFDEKRGVVKINPLATWSDADVSAYLTSRGLPVHPLRDKGYASIGCWPCTRPVAPGEERRAGRWAGTAKTECGLHR